MAYEPYATPEYYREAYGGSVISEDELEKALRQASRHIDSLTYNRIVGRGLSFSAGCDPGGGLPAGGFRV